MRRPIKKQKGEAVTAVLAVVMLTMMVVGIFRGMGPMGMMHHGNNATAPASSEGTAVTQTSPETHNH